MQRVILVAFVAIGCGKSPQPSAVQLLDLPTLDPFQREFDAHRGEPRFVALLSPT